MAKRVWLERKDKGVATVIGALLLVAMGITLFTAFTLWYVPTTVANNQQQSFSSQSASFVSISQQLTSKQYPGKVISESIPLGVAGAPPFSQATQTQLSYENNLSMFSGDLNYSFIVHFKNTTGINRGTSYNHSYSGSYSYSGGFMANVESASASENYLYQINGLTFLSESGGLPYIYYGTPFSVSNVSAGGHYNKSLSLNAFSFNGKSLSVSDYGSSILSMQSIFLNSISYEIGQNVSFISSAQSLYHSIVENITLTGFNYTIQGEFGHTIGQHIYSMFGGGASITSGKWSFHDYPLNATSSGSGGSYTFHLYLYKGGPVELNDLSMQMTTYKVISL